VDGGEAVAAAAKPPVPVFRRRHQATAASTRHGAGRPVEPAAAAAASELAAASTKAAAAKPKPPAKTGIVAEKAETAMKSSSWSPVVAKRGLSEPGTGSSAATKQERAELGVEETAGGRFPPALEIARVKLRSISPTVDAASGAEGSQLARSDGALNGGTATAAADGEQADVPSRSAEPGAAEAPLKTGSKVAESGPSPVAGKNRTARLQVVLRNVAKPSENDSTAGPTGTDAAAAAAAGSQQVVSRNAAGSDQTPSAESKQSETAAVAVGRARETVAGRSAPSLGVKIQPVASEAAAAASSSVSQAGLPPVVSRTGAREKAGTRTDSGDDVIQSASDGSAAAEIPQTSWAKPAGISSSSSKSQPRVGQGEPTCGTSELDRMASSAASQPSEHSDAAVFAAKKESGSDAAFVPVAKRATMFGSSTSTGRQVSVKSTPGCAAAAKISTTPNTHADSSQSTDDGSSAAAASGLAKTVASRAASFRPCVSGGLTRSKAAAAAAAAAEGTRNTSESSASTESVQPSPQGTLAGDAKNEVAVRPTAAAAAGRWPPQAKSEKTAAEKPAGKTAAAGRCAEKSAAAEKPCVKAAEVSVDKQAEKPAEKSSVATGTGQQAVGRTSRVKPSITSSSKTQQPRVSQNAPAEPDKAAGSSPVLSQKPFSVPSQRLKPPGTSSSKNLGRDTRDAGKDGVAGDKASDSVPSAKPSAGSRAGPPAKTMTSVVASETSSSVPKTASTSVGAGPTTADLAAAAARRSNAGAGGGDVTAVTSSSMTSSSSAEPPWLAMARAKTRVWTEGKI